ncbi:BTB/POZ domain containing protein [Sporothrix schenckii 1099-18]|uniref:BTB domain-containing protein n=2 Tax=Sporothrix schenckii TaxID=29908 RepID=U7PXN2_SPOS1|nr:BTB/POZ domain containing protein [Sporothrix schenckii 1099-18]ERS99484.1 hypothetical protein HMPREF1624_04684 [Sporothrix schenckii ATCC 58251]KJR82784.1 BTB/POZ domain containing protein [Sporothrix schenckii 1099-18]
MAMPKGQLEAKLKEEHDMINSGVLREENPLDLTEDFSNFLEACRRGDLKTCQNYILGGVNINGKDEFDYTPLIIASLCGHYEVAQLLLESGALAERNTFQGERCLYNALNDRIRNLLLEYDFSKSADPLQPWSSHITSLLSRREPKTSDITLTASAAPGLTAEEFQLHKFFLAARTPYFHRKLTEAPDLATWKMSNHVAAEAFRIVLHYLYLDDLTPHTAALSDEEELFRSIDKITKQLEVEQLWEAMLVGNDRRLARQRYEDEVERAQQQIEAFFRRHVMGNKMVVETSKVNDVKWPHDNFIFADCLLCADETTDETDAPDDANDDTMNPPERTNSIPIGPAASSASAAPRTQETGASSSSSTSASASAQESKTNGERPSRKPRRSILYPAHKALLVRADYFATMFSSAFLEAQASEHLRIIKMDCAPEVLEIVLSFLYTEQADIPLDLALDVLYVADMLFLEKLKMKAAVIISTLGSGNRFAMNDPTHQEKLASASASASTSNGQDGQGGAGGVGDSGDINVFEVLRAAWDLKVQRLEDFAARFLAARLEHYIDEEEFADFVLESANRLETRQETDTIELIDDIRYFLSERFRLRFEDIALSDMEDDDAEEAAANGDAGGGGGDAVATAAANGVIRTLDGKEVEDEFDSDALNYQILLGKIDSLLKRLGLDA